MDELVEVYIEGVKGSEGDGTEAVLISKEDIIKGLKLRAWVSVISSTIGAMIGERTERGDVILAEIMRRSCIMARDFEAMSDLLKASGGWRSWLVSLMGLLGKLVEMMGGWG